MIDIKMEIEHYCNKNNCNTSKNRIIGTIKKTKTTITTTKPQQSQHHQPHQQQQYQ